jgi:hypothetical protein
VWNTDFSGNLLSNPTGVVSGSSYALESLEPSFQEDLNGDGITGVVTTVLESNGTTKLSQLGDVFMMSPVGGGSGPLIRFNGMAVTAGSVGAWAPLGAEQIGGGGYEVAWKNGAANQYSVWVADANGNLLTNPNGVVSGSSYSLEALEPGFQQDLNNDGTFGLVTTAIETYGSTELVQVADTYSVYPAPFNGLTAQQLKFNGAVVTVGQFGAWAPIAAEQLADGGYEVAWKNGPADQYSVWNADAYGNMLTNPTGVVSGSSPVLKALEPSFQQDLNGDALVGSASVSSSGATLTMATTTTSLLGTRIVSLIEPGPVADDSPASLAVMGNYMASTFVTPSGQNGGISTAAASSDADFLAKPGA